MLAFSITSIMTYTKTTPKQKQTSKGWNDKHIFSQQRDILTINLILDRDGIASISFINNIFKTTPLIRNLKYVSNLIMGWHHFQLLIMKICIMNNYLDKPLLPLNNWNKNVDIKFNACDAFLE